VGEKMTFRKCRKMELVTKALSCSSPSGAFQQLGAEMDIISFNL